MANTFPIKTKIHAYVDKESAYDKGVAIGLAGEALEMFVHFNEVELEIEIEESGIVSKITAAEI